MSTNPPMAVRMPRKTPRTRFTTCSSMNARSVVGVVQRAARRPRRARRGGRGGPRCGRRRRGRTRRRGSSTARRAARSASVVGGGWIDMNVPRTPAERVLLLGHRHRVVAGEPAALVADRGEQPDGLDRRQRRLGRRDRLALEVVEVRAGPTGWLTHPPRPAARMLAAPTTSGRHGRIAARYPPRRPGQTRRTPGPNRTLVSVSGQVFGAGLGATRRRDPAGARAPGRRSPAPPSPRRRRRR